MKPPHYMAHGALRPQQFPVSKRLILSQGKWKLGLVIECPAKHCTWWTAEDGDDPGALALTALVHVAVERVKHRELCQEIWRCYNEATETLLMPPSSYDPMPLYASPLPPICQCGKEPGV